ncbi:hypothetical protein GCM10023224_51190 [Streptomonospora halophila]|uniref:DUF4238 domain-containing protein n=1 Tax=Streptomonospora halophila TaxID=427369 RepID=A0ABP9H0U5_9ACTN
MASKDHTVPQMYLRRFAEKRRQNSFVERVSVESYPNGPAVNVRNVGAIDSFYWSRNFTKKTPHIVEELLGKIETAATPAFNIILDDHDFALPRKWPIPQKHRTSLAWWMAAQILRTTRQRARVVTTTDLAGLDPPPNIKRANFGRDEHLSYIVQNISKLAAILFDKPWAVGFSDCCLLSSDVPVLVLNGQDDKDQLLAAAYWDVFLPLDPHRFLLLPSLGTRKDDYRARADHLAKFPGGLGLAMVQATFDAADKIVLRHPQHRLLHGKVEVDARLPSPDPFIANETSGHAYIINYEVLPPTAQIWKRWAHEHAPAEKQT